MHWPEVLFLLYIPATVAFFGYSVYMETTWRNEVFMTIYAVVVLILGALKILIGSLKSTNQTELLKKCKSQRAFGFFLITIFGILIRILPFYMDSVDAVLYASPLLVFSVISYFFFVAGTRRYCTWDKSLSWKIAVGVVFINVAVPFLAHYLIMESFDEYQQQHFCLYQIGFFGLCLAGTQEMAEISFGAIKLKNEDRMEKTVQIHFPGNEFALHSLRVQNLESFRTHEHPSQHL